MNAFSLTDSLEDGNGEGLIAVLTGVRMAISCMSRACDALVIGSNKSFDVGQFSVQLFALFLCLLPHSILTVKTL